MWIYFINFHNTCGILNYWNLASCLCFGAPLFCYEWYECCLPLVAICWETTLLRPASRSPSPFERYDSWKPNELDTNSAKGKVILSWVYLFWYELSTHQCFAYPGRTRWSTRSNFFQSTELVTNICPFSCQGAASTYYQAGNTYLQQSFSSTSLGSNRSLSPGLGEKHDFFAHGKPRSMSWKNGCKNQKSWWNWLENSWEC